MASDWLLQRVLLLLLLLALVCITGQQHMLLQGEHLKTLPRERLPIMFNPFSSFSSSFPFLSALQLLVAPSDNSLAIAPGLPFPPLPALH